MTTEKTTFTTSIDLPLTLEIDATIESDPESGQQEIRLTLITIHLKTMNKYILDTQGWLSQALEEAGLIDILRDDALESLAQDRMNRGTEK